MMAKLFTTFDGLTPSAVDDPVGRAESNDPATENAIQETATARPTLREDNGVFSIELDLVDDNMSFDLTGTGYAGTGTLVHATKSGTYAAKVNLPDGEYNFTVNPLYFPTDNIVQLFIVARDLNGSDRETLRQFAIQNRGAGDNFAGVTSMSQWFRQRTDVVEIYSGDWDTSSVTSFGSFARNASSLTTLDVSGWDTSSVTNFNSFASDANSLTALDVSGWDTSSVTNFGSFARFASSLTELDVSGWDTSSVTNFGSFASDANSLTALDVSGWDTSSVTTFSNFARDASSLTTVTVTGGTGNPFADSAATSYAFAFSGTNLNQASIDAILVAIEQADTSNGTFNQSGGSAPSATGEDAVTALRGRGWTVTVTGGF
jgi:surface protein